MCFPFLVIRFVDFGLEKRGLFPKTRFPCRIKREEGASWTIKLIGYEELKWRQVLHSAANPSESLAATASSPRLQDNVPAILFSSLPSLFF